MKKFALMIAIMILSVFCMSFAFAAEEANDVADVPLLISEKSGEDEEKTTVEEPTGLSGETEEKTEDAPVVEVQCGESTETKEEGNGLEDGKGGNPVGGIIAIVVVILLVLLIAFLNRG